MRIHNNSLFSIDVFALSVPARQLNKYNWRKQKHRGQYTGKGASGTRDHRRESPGRTGMVKSGIAGTKTDNRKYVQNYKDNPQHIWSPRRTPSPNQVRNPPTQKKNHSRMAHNRRIRQPYPYARYVWVLASIRRGTYAMNMHKWPIWFPVARREEEREDTGKGASGTWEHRRESPGITGMAKIE